MTDDQAVPLPPGAVEAAAGFLHDDQCEDGDTRTCARWVTGSDPASHVLFYRAMASGALAAAADVLYAEGAATEREACARLAEQEADRNVSLLSTYSGDDALREFAHLIRARTTP